nr:hypothetical protein [Streptomyces lavendulae]
MHARDLWSARAAEDLCHRTVGRGQFGAEADPEMVDGETRSLTPR